MHLFSNKTSSAALVGIFTTIIAVVLRIILMFFGFDSETLFYDNKILATLLYLFVIISFALVYLFFKKVRSFETVNEKYNRIFSFLCAIVFAVLFFVELSVTVSESALTLITHKLSIFFSALTVIYYLLEGFYSRNKSTALQYFSIAPVLYLLSFSIDSFIAVSIKANSYYLFPHVFSIIFLAFYIINYSKYLNCTYEKYIPMFSYTVMSFVILSFSVIPDVIFLLSGNIQFSNKDIAITLFKAIFIIRNVFEILATVKEKQ